MTTDFICVACTGSYSVPVGLSLNGGSAALVIYALLVLGFVRSVGVIVGHWSRRIP